jgi:hypothetical protein
MVKVMIKMWLNHHFPWLNAHVPHVLMLHSAPFCAEFFALLEAMLRGATFGGRAVGQTLVGVLCYGNGGYRKPLMGCGFV